MGNQDAAVQRAIEEHLSRRSDLAMDQMVLEMQQVSVEGDRAQAEVVFRTTMDPPARMAYHYELLWEDGRWRVESGRPSATETPHPVMGEAEAGASPESMMDELPEGHPVLPGDHPPIEQVNPHGEVSPPSQ
jgi:hypothetical protein